MTKTYLVVSVSQINALARAVKRNRKAHKAHKAHTVILHLQTVPNQSVNGREQLDGIAANISRINTDSHNAEFLARRVDKAVQTV